MGFPCAMRRTLGQMVQVVLVPWGVRWVRWYRFSMYHGAYARSDGTGFPCTMGRTLGQMVYRFPMYHGAYTRPDGIGFPCTMRRTACQIL